MKRKYSVILALILVLVLAVPALGAEGLPHVVDEAGLLTSGEEARLEEEAARISEQYRCDVVILTVDDIGSKSPMAYADDYFDEHGYGYGEEFSGVLLLLSMAERDWWLSTCGYGIEAFTDYGQAYLMDSVLPLLGDGDYSGAFAQYLEGSEELLELARAGKPLDAPRQEPQRRPDRTEKSGGFPWMGLGVCVVLGFVLALIPMGVLRRQVHNVAPQQDAMDYVAAEGLELSRKTDRFLYSRVSKRARPKQTSSSSGGGSSTHVSSSGRSHGGSGGKF